MFTELQLSNWRQFDDIRIQFHPQLTILTGANGAGKTTLLNILSRHFGWNIALLSTPRQRRGGLLKYFSGFRTSKSKTPSTPTIGRIAYGGGGKSEIHVPVEVGQSYNVEIPQQQSVQGIYIPSHRPVYFYQQVSQIPTQLSAREQLLSIYTSEYMNRYVGAHTGYSPSYRLKEALISLATFGYGNKAVEANAQAVETFERFQDILRIILPEPLGFRNVRIRMPEVVMETDTGDFSFDAVSGGVAALLDVAWQIHIASLVYESFVVVMDEPENHLHPSLQQSMLPKLLKAFPKVQFICASHNPFIVGSVPDSHVYVLRFNEQRSVQSELLDTVNKAGSSNEILRDVLGLSFTMPLWVEDRVADIVDRHAGQEVTESDLTDIRAEMNALGLGHLYPEAVTRVLAPRHDQDQ